MPVRSNSAAALTSIKVKVPGKRQEVLDKIKLNPSITRQDIAADLGWPINSVTGRVTELINSGHIREKGSAFINNRKRALLEPV